jgi:hypothetical protein
MTPKQTPAPQPVTFVQHPSAVQAIVVPLVQVEKRPRPHV